MDTDLLKERFVGFRQLVGDERYGRIAGASVCVVGLGGVGSWVVEALARSGVGTISLVDLDDVCITNMNRQLHALSSTVGRSKAHILGERVLEINPSCQVSVNRKFFSATTADEILGRPHSLVIDTIDSVDQKVLLIAECAARGIRLITVGSAGNRLSPRLATVQDLSKTIHDPLLQIVRKRLRQEHSFPRSERTKFDIPCIYAPLQRGPRILKGEACSNERGVPTERTGANCNAGLGSAVFVTGTLGFLAASEAIEVLSSQPLTNPYPWIERRRARLSEPV
jgi:tRNA A37 threonylcarbamoyladenosine dehydratase